MSEFEIYESETIKLALSVIDKLLSQPLGSQVYAKEIKSLLDLITVQTVPPTIINHPPTQ